MILSVIRSGGRQGSKPCGGLTFLVQILIYGGATMLEKRFCGYKKDGSQLILSDKEIIEKALEQEKDGVKPQYAFYAWNN